MPKYNCIVIDDDAFAATILKNYCEKCEGLNLLGKFVNGVEAKKYLDEYPNVDIIFLDIEMPVMNGMDFMRSVNHTGAQVIVCSSKSQYAVETYEYNVCDYLLKPVSYDRFIRSVEKAILEIDKMKKWIVASSVAEGVEGEDSETDIWIKDIDGKQLRIKIEDIVYIEAMENYMSMQTKQKRYTIHSTMKSVMEMFGAKTPVMRVHKSYAVNIDNMLRLEDGCLVAEVQGDKMSISVGRTYMKELRDRISKR